MIGRLIEEGTYRLIRGTGPLVRRAPGRCRGRPRPSFKAVTKSWIEWIGRSNSVK